MDPLKIGIIGNGSVGTKLAGLALSAGHEVALGARNKDAQQTGFAEAAAFGELVILAIPFSATAPVLSELAELLVGKVVIDVTNPLNADWSPLPLGENNSAGEEHQRRLPGSRLVKAFNTIFADAMVRRPDAPVGAETVALLCGDHAAANRQVAALATQMGFKPLDAGPLRMARYLEGLAHLNIQLAVGMGGGTRAAFGYHTITEVGAP